MSEIGSNIHRNNVSGSAATVQLALNNDHDESMKIIDEQAALARLQENNQYNLKNKKLDIDFEAQKAKNQRDLIETQGRVDVNRINAESNAEQARLQLQNQRQKDNEQHQERVLNANNQHKENMQRMEHTQEINRMEANRKLEETRGKMQVDLENAREHNKRESK